MWKENRRYGDRDKALEQQRSLNVEMMSIFAEIGTLRDGDSEGEDAQKLIRKLQDHITENYYNCTKEILLSLGEMYANGGEFTANIDKAGGEGTAEFACRAIKACCSR